MKGCGGAVALVVLALGSFPTTAGATLLERHVPVLRYDRDETHFAQPVTREGTVIAEDVVYGRVARENGARWLQYWLFYAYNSQDRGLFGTGRHEGDWEFLQLRVDERDGPDAATFAQHSWAEGCEWTDLELAGPGGARPVVYVANGSHASYPRPGTTDRPWPDPNDEADGDGRAVLPRLISIADERPGWVADPEPWGSSRAGPIPGEESSPRGPRFTGDDRWTHPASYHREHGRSCGSGAPGRRWQTVLSVVVVATLMIALAYYARRRRRTSRLQT